MVGLKERDCTCNDGNGILLLSLESGLRASRGKNVNSK